MAAKFASEKNIRFLLHDVFDIQSITAFDRYADHTPKTIDMAVKAAFQFAKEKLFPIFGEMDRNQPQFSNGQVTVHPAVKEILREAGEGGWIAARFPYEAGGEQLPNMVADLCYFIFSCANYSAGAYSLLTSGAAGLIHSFGSKSLRETYIPPMFSGN